MKTIYPGEARDRCKERGTLMNRIYKVVWNAARNAYVVGSEFIHSSRRVGGGTVNAALPGPLSPPPFSAAPCGVPRRP